MNELIAFRTLKYKNLSSGTAGELTVEIYMPYLLEQAKVDFPITEGNAGCLVKVLGLGTDQYDQHVYGVDTLQALSMAVQVDEVLRHISKTHKLYFQDGDPYFE